MNKPEPPPITTNEEMSAWENSNRVRVARLRKAKRLPATCVGRWVPVHEVLPPERFPVLVNLCAEPDMPAFAWLKYAAGELDSPFFVCPQKAALEPRGIVKVEEREVESCALGYPITMKKEPLGSTGVLSWFSPTSEPMIKYPIDAPKQGHAVVGDGECGWCYFNP